MSQVLTADGLGLGLRAQLAGLRLLFALRHQLRLLGQLLGSGLLRQAQLPSPRPLVLSCAW